MVVPKSFAQAFGARLPFDMAGGGDQFPTDGGGVAQRGHLARSLHTAGSGAHSNMHLLISEFQKMADRMQNDATYGRRLLRAVNEVICCPESGAPACAIFVFV